MSEDEVGKQAADVSPEEIRGMLQISFITCTALEMSNVKQMMYVTNAAGLFEY